MLLQACTRTVIWKCNSSCASLPTSCCVRRWLRDAERRSGDADGRAERRLAVGRKLTQRASTTRSGVCGEPDGLRELVSPTLHAFFWPIERSDSLQTTCRVMSTSNPALPIAELTKNRRRRSRACNRDGPARDMRGANHPRCGLAGSGLLARCLCEGGGPRDARIASVEASRDSSRHEGVTPGSGGLGRALDRLVRAKSHALPEGRPRLFSGVSKTPEAGQPPARA